MSEEGSTSSTQNPKLVLGTALITALTTIGVSFVGIVPQLRSGDKQALTEVEKERSDAQRELADLRKDVEELRGRPRAVGTTGTEEPRVGTNETMIISGTVRGEDGTRLLTGYDVYLLEVGPNLLTATTDDAGKFRFQRVPAGTYSIVVRDSSNGRSGRGLLDAASGEVQMLGAKVKYRIQQ